ncbi:MAG: hypothetical protein LBQ36_00495 [Synergistaceae bacterium]|jgi:hypothetical protein|nr:hypothetical protein [Synergistaceae bacterium]
MRVFAIVGLLVTVAIIGFLAAAFLSQATRPMTAIPADVLPAGKSADSDIGGASPRQGNAIDAARAVASVDRARQQEAQELMNRMDGITGNP